ncbi:MAG: hypothetical protein VR70_05955 [Rhodospirillaceae bacterium BRH_c57]|nr:MAG: hypothetical protein VR70_05955 [Rhodospirillaceae bacterium BRH_c57]
MSATVPSESMDQGTADRLRSMIERVERLESEKGDISEDIKGVFQEAKSEGFDTKAMKAIIRLRKKEAHEREEEEQLLELYRQAIGV